MPSSNSGLMISAPTERTTLRLSGMTCNHCVQTVERTLLELEGVASATADLGGQSATVDFIPELVDIPALEKAAKAAGYGPPVQAPATTLVTIQPGPAPKRKAAKPVPKLEDRTLRIDGMTCASCVRSVETAAVSAPGVVSCSVSLTEGTAVLKLNPAAGDIKGVVGAIRAAGYGATTEVSADGEDTDASAQSRRLTASAALTAPLLVLAMAPGLAAIPGADWIQLALTVPVLVYGGAPIYAAAWHAACHWRSDMNTLIAVGTLSAFAYSLASLLFPALISPTGEPSLYFETSAAIISLVLTGRMLEARARHRTSAAIRKLMELQSGTLLVRRGRREVEVPPHDVVVGDEVLVHPGQRVAVDGTVVEGAGSIDESPVTGESVPVEKREGDQVTSGSLSVDGFLVVRATSVGADTTLARIIEFVRNAQASKAPAAQLADRIAAVFVPVVLAIAAVTFVLWMVLGQSEDTLRVAVSSAVSVLIIACPCALGLATPAALAVGIGRGAQRGILIRDGAALEGAGHVDTVVFDKTGTLTTGRLALTDIKPLGRTTKDKILRAAAAIESRSEHPIARAIAEAAPGGLAAAVQDYRSLPGAGATGSLNGHRWLLGKQALLEEDGTSTLAAQATLDRFGSEGKTTVLASMDGELQGVLALRDTLRQESRAAAAALHRRGIATLMLSGDSAAVATAIASEAGIQKALAPVMPVEKSDAIRRLQDGGRRVAMVGDGINDAPALAQADLGIAIGSGTDIAAESADVILVRDDPTDVGRAIELSVRTQRTIGQNYWWAFGYNLLGIPIAAGLLYPWTGMLLSPMLASAAMVLSSLSVLTNSLRLRGALADGR